MLRISRRLAAIALAGCVAPLTVAASTPAAADPVFHLTYLNTDGSTHLAKPNVTAAIPTSSVVADLDLGTGQLTGTAQIPDLTVTLSVLGLRLSAVTRLVPVGGLTGMLSGDTLSSTTTFKLQILKLFPTGSPRLNLVTPGCQSVRATSATLTNTTPINLFDITLAGSYSIPSFVHCGLLTGIINLTLAGPGNTLTLHLH
jgi:hypothetical protein